jgi:cyanophycin synthetase
VVKPLDAGGGKGVTANIRTLAEAQTAFPVAFRQKQGPVMVEAHVPGDDHRLMVVDGRLVAAIRREPSSVVGDGHKSVAALVDELNAPRSGNMVRSRYLRPIALGAVLVHHLVTQSLKLADIPAAGRRITLRSNANLSTGGVCTDVTAVCHPQVRALAELLAKTSGLTTVGIDYLTTDISTAPAEAGGAFIEMNTTPGLDACVAAGWSEAAIARMVLGESVGRIPVDLTVLSAAGLGALRSGGVTPLLAEDEALIIVDALHVGQMTLRMGTAEPWAAVKAGLRNPGVAALHVICSAEDLDRLGCPVDRFRLVKIAVAEGRAIISPGWCEVLSRQGQPAVVYESEQNILDRLTSPEPDPMRGAW